MPAVLQPVAPLLSTSIRVRNSIVAALANTGNNARNKNEETSKRRFAVMATPIDKMATPGVFPGRSQLDAEIGPVNFTPFWKRHIAAITYGRRKGRRFRRPFHH